METFNENCNRVDTSKIFQDSSIESNSRRLLYHNNSCKAKHKSIFSFLLVNSCNKLYQVLNIYDESWPLPAFHSVIDILPTLLSLTKIQTDV